MSPPPPLPSPAPDPAVRTYVRAILAMLPAVLIWSFAAVFLAPKLEQLWRDTGLTNSPAAWLLYTCQVFRNACFFIAAALVSLCTLLEFFWPPWPRYRHVVLASFAYWLQTAVLVGLAMFATAALLAAPKSKRTPVPTQVGSLLRSPLCSLAASV